MSILSGTEPPRKRSTSPVFESLLWQTPFVLQKLPGVKLEHKLEAIRYHVGEDKAKLGILQREVDKYRAVLRDWLEDNPEG